MMQLQTTLGGRNLIVRFHKTQDRFSHQILVSDPANQESDSADVVVVQSVEGDDQQDQPPSPAIQDLSVEDRGPTEVALGVGMSGESIWSISAESWKEKGFIQFDIACNPRGEHPEGTCTYQVCGKEESLTPSDSPVSSSDPVLKEFDSPTFHLSSIPVFIQPSQGTDIKVRSGEGTEFQELDQGSKETTVESFQLCATDQSKQIINQRPVISWSYRIGLSE